LRSANTITNTKVAAADELEKEKLYGALGVPVPTVVAGDYEDEDETPDDELGIATVDDLEKISKEVI